MVSLIWNIADDVLRDVFLRGQYRDVILPMVVLRRLDALLEPTKNDVDKEVNDQREMKMEVLDEDAIKDITGLSYFNTSKWTLNRLKSQATDNNDLLYDNFAEYLNGYSENVRDVLKNFDYFIKAKKLADNDRLLAIIERITDPRINLTDKDVKGPDGLKIPPSLISAWGPSSRNSSVASMKKTTRKQENTSPRVTPSPCWPTWCSNP